MNLSLFLLRIFLLTFIFLVLLNSAHTRASELNFSGLIEIESFSQTHSNETTLNELSVATAEFSFDKILNEQLSANLQFLYEQDGTPLELDTATVTMHVDAQLSVMIGQMYLPFGVFETEQVSDPLTLELGESRENAMAAHWSAPNISFDAYLFSHTDTKGSNEFGLNISTQPFGEDSQLNIHYISSLLFSTNDEDISASVAGLNIFAQFKLHSITGRLEIIKTLDSYSLGTTNVQPNSYNIEASYAFVNNTAFTLGYQQLGDAIFFELPESRIITSYGFAPIFGGLNLKTEITHDTYKQEGNSYSLTLQAAIEI